MVASGVHHLPISKSQRILETHSNIEEKQLLHYPLKTLTFFPLLFYNLL